MLIKYYDVSEINIYKDYGLFDLNMGSPSSQNLRVRLNINILILNRDNNNFYYFNIINFNRTTIQYGSLNNMDPCRLVHFL